MLYAIFLLFVELSHFLLAFILSSLSLILIKCFLTVLHFLLDRAVIHLYI